MWFTLLKQAHNCLILPSMNTQIPENMRKLMDTTANLVNSDNYLCFVRICPQYTKHFLAYDYYILEVVIIIAFLARVGLHFYFGHGYVDPKSKCLSFLRWDTFLVGRIYISTAYGNTDEQILQGTLLVNRCTMRSRYIAVTFIQITHERHPYLAR